MLIALFHSPHTKRCMAVPYKPLPHYHLPCKQNLLTLPSFSPRFLGGGVRRFCLQDNYHYNKQAKQLHFSSLGIPVTLKSTLRDYLLWNLYMGAVSMEGRGGGRGVCAIHCGWNIGIASCSKSAIVAGKISTNNKYMVISRHNDN